MVAEPRPVSSCERFGPVGPRRLLLLSTNMGMGGGAEEQVIQLAYAFKARGWDTRIVSMLPPSPMPADFAGRGIGLTDLGMRRGLPDPRAIFRLARLLREFRPDVVHSHMTHANLLARAVRLFQPFPVLICTLHALDMAGVERDRGAIFEFAHRLTEALTDRTTAICHAASDYYVRRRAVAADKMIVMPNGIDTDRFITGPETRDRMRQALGITGQFTWLAVGRLEQVKAYPTLLRAFARVADSSATLLICGQGSLAADLGALADELKIAARVRFLGLRADIPDVMSAADAFVMSSDSEGLPLVLLQASAAGLPIVSTDVGGAGEVVVDGATGYLVPAGNPAALARAMDRMAALPQVDRAAMGRAGRARVQTMFQAQRIVDRWERLYRQLLDGAGTGPGGDTARPRRLAVVR